MRIIYVKKPKGAHLQNWNILTSFVHATPLQFSRKKHIFYKLNNLKNAKIMTNILDVNFTQKSLKIFHTKTALKRNILTTYTKAMDKKTFHLSVSVQFTHAYMSFSFHEKT